MERNTAKALYLSKLFCSFYNNCTIYFQKKIVKLSVLLLTDHDNGEARGLLEDPHDQSNEGKQT